MKYILDKVFLVLAILLLFPVSCSSSSTSNALLEASIERIVDKFIPPLIVELSADNSTVADSKTIVEYEWEQTKGEPVNIINIDDSNIRFILPNVDSSIEISLIVVDDSGEQSEPATYQIESRQNEHTDNIINAGDYILRCQNSDGAIADAWDSSWFNVDNNMGYALASLNYAYLIAGDVKYLNAVKKALIWQAGLQDDDGAWHLSYKKENGKYVVVVNSGDAEDVKVVDAIQSFFAYNLWLYSLVSNDLEFVDSYKNIAKKGIDRLIDDNLDENNRFIYSSWRLEDDVWDRLDIKYAMGQGDVYLGLMAISKLHSNDSYFDYAQNIKENFDSYFWNSINKRYGIGIDMSDIIDDEEYILAQCMPVFFMNEDFVHAEDAMNYLVARQQTTGAVKAEDNDKLYSLDSACLALARTVVTSESAVNKAIDYVVSMQISGGEGDGAIKYNKSDSEDNLSNLYINVSSFSIIALALN